MQTEPGPPRRKIATLKDGFWEETAIYESPDGGQVVRKASKPTAETGPWAHSTLRREIRYLKELPPAARSLFPPVLRAWGDAAEAGAENSPDLGYEIPYYQDCISVADRIATQDHAVTPEERASFQADLARHLFDTLHTPVPREESLAAHVKETLATAINTLGKIERFAKVIQQPVITLNGGTGPGLQRVFADLLTADFFDRLDRGSCVRLHGDLILENILCPRGRDAPWKVERFIDPVSVAGITAGPPLFDLVKYESYASGELLAIRSELATAGPSLPRRTNSFTFAWDHQDPRLAPYRDGAWHREFGRAYVDRYGPIDRAVYHLLDGYFSLVMAVNTTGHQQWARVLKGADALTRLSRFTRARIFFPRKISCSKSRFPR